MPAVVAILFSCLLGWAQVVSARTAFDPAWAGPTCCGCQCGDLSCCAPRAPTGPQPPPVSAPRPVVRDAVKLPAPPLLWMPAPRWRPVTVFSVPSTPAWAPAVPRYQQHLALLI